MNNETNSVPFEMVINALLDGNKPFPPKYLHQFSDLGPDACGQLKKIWMEIQPARRAALLEDLEKISESDTLVSFDELCEIAFLDNEPRVRAAAIRMLWDSERAALIPTFIRFMKEDEDRIVRSSAASILGRFVYLGELEEIQPKIQDQVIESLLEVMRGDDHKSVRRHALEALGFTSSNEITDLINKAYNSNDKDWISSALFAMGRSADEQWVENVLKMIEHPLDEIQAEAIRAAGELEIKQARKLLLDLLEYPENLDEEVRLSCIWAISQIGGEDVREVLENLLDEIEDDEEISLIEQSLENLEFTEGFPDFDMFSFDVPDKERPDELQGS